MASLPEADKQAPEFTSVLAKISADDRVRARYVDAMRRADPPTLRERMITLGATLGWFTPDEERGEQLALINDMLAQRTMGFAEVGLVCSMNASHALDGELKRVDAPRAAAGYAPHVAALACLGDTSSHERMLRTLASGDE